MAGKEFEKYANLCFICNVAVVVIMSVATAIIMYLIGIDLTISIIASVVLFWLYAWIEEHHISKYVNLFIEKILKYENK